MSRVRERSILVVQNKQKSLQKMKYKEKPRQHTASEENPYEFCHHDHTTTYRNVSRGEELAIHMQHPEHNQTSARL